jgi:tRNA 2-selenouridine synthase
MRLPTLPAEDFLARPGFALLDVRAEVEFAEGHVPGSVNLPLLTTPERHEVGIVYKRDGQDAAVKLGHQLVDPHRSERVAGWRRFLDGQREPVLTCFRGGMRSQISQQWITESGLPCVRVEGGYKAMRRVLFSQWEKPVRGFVVTGLTGSNKTGFVRSLNSPRAVDLEAIAVHRGSAFGGLFQPTPQPSQQTFENALGLALFQNKGDFVFEDESRLVGRCVIPGEFFERMKGLPRVFLETTDEERAAHIFEEYVEVPLQRLSAAEVEKELLTALRTLRNRLGGLAAAEIEAEVKAAFTSQEREAHLKWISRLLRDYYDGMYRHAMSRHEGAPVFRGRAEELRHWLKKNSDLK